MAIDPELETTVADVVLNREQGALQIIDVREREEWAEGHIAGSLLIPMSEFAERAHDIDVARPIVTVCRSGVRSLYVSQALQAAGVANVRSMAGGMIAWKEAGQPVEV